MRFETLTLDRALDRAEGALLAHGIRVSGSLFKKGRVLNRADLDALRQAGIEHVTIARIEPDDIPEDQAATSLGAALKGEGLKLGAAFTGRVNLYAEKPGLAIVDRNTIDRINLVDESLTVATLAPFAAVGRDEMVATVKIIPFAAPKPAFEAAMIAAHAAPIRIAPFTIAKVALISTRLPGQKPALLDKNRSALETRLKAVGASLIVEKRISHDADAVAQALRACAAAGAELLFVFGASAITDRRDVIPAGIVAAGGTIVHFGMPVDPGNLMLLGALNATPVVGLPSCARSPKVNGFDFVLQRLCAGLELKSQDIMRMGVGGLLQEIPSRPQPRNTELSLLRAPRIASVILAAGLSSRMGANKLLADWRGKPLIRFVAEATALSQARPAIVVTGHEHDKIETALDGLDVRFVHNPDFTEGLSTSLKAGLRALPDDCDGALVLLGDMPEITPSLIDRMIAAFSPADGRAICIAAHEHRRGNPVLWARRFFEEIDAVSGDSGAKSILALYEDSICEIEAGPASLRDIDTRDDLAGLKARPASEPVS